MKYIVVLGDGMADEPLEELGGKTPLEYAATPRMDWLAARSEIGMTATIPAGMAPGSDTANLSVLGYDPKQYYTGRSPLEALSIGAQMEDGDIALRCNLVTLTEEDAPYEEQTILDHSSGEISTEDAGILLNAVVEQLDQLPSLYALEKRPPAGAYAAPRHPGEKDRPVADHRPIAALHSETQL